MPLSVWYFIKNGRIFGGTRDFILIEKFSATNPSQKLYELGFHSGQFDLQYDGTLFEPTGSPELIARVMRTLRDNAGHRTVITRYRHERPQRKVAQLFIDNRGFVHRNPEEGPAYWNGRQFKAYCWHGLLHRVGKPATIRHDYDDRVLDQNIYFRFGRWHRDLKEGAAYTDQEPKRYFQRIYAMRGHRYRSPKEGGQRRTRTDSEYGERFSRYELNTIDEPAVSWLRWRYDMLRRTRPNRPEQTGSNPSKPDGTTPADGPPLL